MDDKHREYGRCENFELVSDLISCRVQIGQCIKGKIVLEGVKRCWHQNFDTLADVPEDFPV